MISNKFFTSFRGKPCLLFSWLFLSLKSLPSFYVLLFFFLNGMFHDNTIRIVKNMYKQVHGISKLICVIYLWSVFQTHFVFSSQEGQHFITIPRKLMMSAETARNSDLGSHSVQMIYYTDIIDHRKSNFYVEWESMIGWQEWRLVLPLTPVNYQDRISPNFTNWKLQNAKLELIVDPTPNSPS